MTANIFLMNRGEPEKSGLPLFFYRDLEIFWIFGGNVLNLQAIRVMIRRVVQIF